MKKTEHNTVEESYYYWKGKPIIDQRESVTSGKPTVVELFCGCGGTSLGFEMAGYNILLGVDIHRPSIETFKKNHPNSSTILGDIKKIDPDMVRGIVGNREIDVLVAGVPCQGFSLNNRKRHQDDKRNFLYREFFRFARALNPKAIVIENVSGIRSSGNGKFANRIEKEISKLLNTVVKSKVLYAPDYGVPQKRQRVIFVGFRDGNEFNFDLVKKTHGPVVGVPYVTVKEAIGDLPSLKAGECKDSYNFSPKSEYQKLMRFNSQTKIFNHVAPNHPPETIRKIQNTLPGKPIYPKYKQRIRLSWNDLSPTQVSGGIRPQFQFGHPQDARGLSIRERCRLQSFPDNFNVSGGIVQGRVQTGNAVPPLLAKALGTAIKKYL